MIAKGSLYVLKSCEKILLIMYGHTDYDEGGKHFFNVQFKISTRNTLYKQIHPGHSNTYYYMSPL